MVKYTLSQTSPGHLKRVVHSNRRVAEHALLEKPVDLVNLQNTEDGRRNSKSGPKIRLPPHTRGCREEGRNCAYTSPINPSSFKSLIELLKNRGGEGQNFQISKNRQKKISNRKQRIFLKKSEILDRLFLN